MSVTRRQLLTRIDEAWKKLQASYTGLTPDELLEPGVTGAWSVRDILAHVTTWEEEALTHLPLILKGGTPPRYSVLYGGIDAFNARTTEEKRGPIALRDSRATGSHARPSDRARSERPRGSARRRHPVPSAATTRYLRALPDPCGGDPAMAAAKGRPPGKAALTALHYIVRP